MKGPRVLRLAVSGAAAARTSPHRSRDRRSRSAVLRAAVEADRTVMEVAADPRQWHLVAEVDRKVAEEVLRPEPAEDLRVAAEAARTAAVVEVAVATAAATAKGNGNNIQNTTEYCLTLPLREGRFFQTPRARKIGEGTGRAPKSLRGSGQRESACCMTHTDGYCARQ
jgi:hypothetical protein